MSRNPIAPRANNQSPTLSLSDDAKSITYFFPPGCGMPLSLTMPVVIIKETRKRCGVAWVVCPHCRIGEPHELVEGTRHLACRTQVYLRLKGETEPFLNIGETRRPLGV